jgi:LPXTG-site transpeptidase (sortase) family protein
MSNNYYQSEIHKLLKLGPDLSQSYEPEPAEPELAQATGATASVNAVPFGLPVRETDLFPNFKSDNPGQTQTIENSPPTFQTAPGELFLPGVTSQAKNTQPQASGQWSSFVTYPAVFLVAFGFFYAMLNFNALWIQVNGWFAPDQNEAILAEDMTAYYNWINGYFFAVQDREKLGPNQDVDGDGMTNYDEFLIKTNPTVADSDNDGVSDGIEAINGSNPWGRGSMTKKQTVVMESVDLIKVNNRISMNVAAENSPVASVDTAQFDMTKPGRLSIPKLGIQIPVIWTQDPADFDADLTRGSVHYPGTAMPGETGIVYISGHSSDYLWKNHPYKYIFSKINALEPGDDIFVDVYGKDGQIYNYRYKVSTESIYAPDDQRQFIDNSGAKLNLSTCWPIGTQKDRYVVTAELTNL